jgi:hypothetical protein
LPASADLNLLRQHKDEVDQLKDQLSRLSGARAPLVKHVVQPLTVMHARVRRISFADQLVHSPPIPQFSPARARIFAATGQLL